MGIHDIILATVSGILFLSPTNQHFIWPLGWCLLADICNHTWITECGSSKTRTNQYRLFIDSCDMFEYNCDFAEDYISVNISSCFQNIWSTCPPVIPCPSIPPCPDHRRHRLGQMMKSACGACHKSHTIKTSTVTIDPKWPYGPPPPNLPKYMLQGRRRYTPKRGKARRERALKNDDANKATSTTESTSDVNLKTVILKRETIIKNGKMVVKVIKGFIKSKKVPNIINSDNDEFLEN